MLTKIRVAYYGTDRFGANIVMLSNEYFDPSRPGWSRGVTQSFKRTADIREAEALAKRMKSRGQADIVKAL